VNLIVVNLVKSQRIIIGSILLILAVLPSYGATSNLTGVDPTKPLFGSKQSKVVKVAKNLVLQSIFHGSYGEKTHTAIINGMVLQVNDYIGEYRLVAVNDDSVVLRSSDKRLKLSIFSSIVKK
jgi:hypothetical protein|tara:strand:- start:80 stop:448 length:369 start_codon:yes stop_codon:yes gene_type:complete